MVTIAKVVAAVMTIMTAEGSAKKWVVMMVDGRCDRGKAAGGGGNSGGDRRWWLLMAEAVVIGVGGMVLEVIMVATAIQVDPDACVTNHTQQHEERHEHTHNAWPETRVRSGHTYVQHAFPQAKATRTRQSTNFCRTARALLHL